MKKYGWFLAIGVLLSLWGFNAWRRSHYYYLSVQWPNLTETAPASMRVVQMDDAAHVHQESTGPAGKGMFFELNKKYRASELAVQVKTPQGWTECPAEVDIRDSGTFTLRLKIGMVHLWVDNLDGKDCVVSCGEFRLSCKAGDKPNMTFPTPLGKPVPLQLDERQVGEIMPVDPKAFLGDAGYLLDCSGERSYLHEAIIYEGSKGIPQGPNFGGSKNHLAGKHLHRLPSATVDYFLVPAPQSIEIQTYGPVLVQERRIKYMLVRD